MVEVGYTAAQLDEIADRAGLTKGAIYSIFGGKLELLRAVVEEHARQVFPLLEWEFDVDADTTAEDLLAALVRKYVGYLREHNTTKLLAFELDLSVLALRDPATLEIVLAHERAVTDRLAGSLAGRRRRGGRPLSDDEAAVAADLVLGALGGLGQRLATAPWMTWDADVIAESLTGLLPSGQPARARA